MLGDDFQALRLVGAGFEGWTDSRRCCRVSRAHSSAAPLVKRRTRRGAWHEEIGIVEGVNAVTPDERKHRCLGWMNRAAAVLAILRSDCPPQSHLRIESESNRQLLGDDAEGACNNDIESENKKNNNKQGTRRQAGEMDERGEAVEGRGGAEEVQTCQYRGCLSC